MPWLLILERRNQFLDLLEQEDLELINILVTHYHDDHTGGIETLTKKTACHVIGPDDNRVPKLEQSVDEGERTDVWALCN